MNAQATDTNTDEIPVAPRVTEERINEVIQSLDFFKLSDTLMVCKMTLINGYQVVGKSACASPENFDEEIGKDLAYQDAREQVWPLEGYLLKQYLYLVEQEKAAAAAPQIVVPGILVPGSN